MKNLIGTLIVVLVVITSCGEQGNRYDSSNGTWKMVIEPQFDGVTRFSEGLAFGKGENTCIGLGLP